MHPIKFEGSEEISKPANMTDEQCMSLWAKFGFDLLFKIFQSGGLATLPLNIYAGIDTDKFPFYMTAWQPNKEDIEAINRGEPIYVKVLARQLPPMAIFTLDENNEGNF